MADAVVSQVAGNGSDIDSLGRRVDDLTHAVDSWNNWMLVGLVIAAVAAAWILVTTRVAVIRSKQLVTAQEQLDLAKDRQLQTDLKAKDLEIGELKVKSEAAEAEISAAKLEAANAALKAAEASRQSEAEKLERARLELSLSARGPQIWGAEGEFQKAIGPFAGQKVELAVCGGNENDMEVSMTLGAIEHQLLKAKWERTVVVDRRCSSGTGTAGTGIDVKTGNPWSAASRAAADAVALVLEKVLWGESQPEAYAAQLKRGHGFIWLGNGERFELGSSAMPVLSPTDMPLASDTIRIEVFTRPPLNSIFIPKEPHK
jgi:hypothetical protein